MSRKIPGFLRKTPVVMALRRMALHRFLSDRSEVRIFPGAPRKTAFLECAETFVSPSLSP